MELPHRAVARLAALAAARCALVACAALAGAAHAADLDAARRRSREPPRFFEHSAREVERIAARAEKVRRARSSDGPLQPSAYTKGLGRWQVSWFRDGQEIVQVQVDDRTGAIARAVVRRQVAWTMARGYPGAFGRKLNAPYVWIPLCVLFLLPFLDSRRPFRLLHLDLLVLLAFGVSHYLLQPRRDRRVGAARVPGAPVPARARAVRGFRPRASRAGALVPHASLTLARAWALVFLVGVPDRPERGRLERDRRGLRGRDRRRPDRGRPPAVRRRLLERRRARRHLRPGQLPRVRAVRAGAAVERALGRPARGPRRGDRVRPAGARRAAAARPAAARRAATGTVLGVALAYAWVAYPYTTFVLESNSNDTLVAVACVGALLRRDRSRATAPRAAVAAAGDRAAGRGREVRDRGAGAPVRAAVAGRAARRRSCSWWRSRSSPFIPDGGLRELYDRTVGYQASRPSPFSIWGQVDSLGWLQNIVKGAAAGLAVLGGVPPERARPAPDRRDGRRDPDRASS